jgi:hypothetical protein
MRCAHYEISAGILLDCYRCRGIPWFAAMRLLQLLRWCTKLPGATVAGSAALFVEQLQRARSPGDPPRWAPSDLDLWVDDRGNLPSIAARLCDFLCDRLHVTPELRVRTGGWKDTVLHSVTVGAVAAADFDHIGLETLHGAPEADSALPSDWENGIWGEAYPGSLEHCEVSFGAWSVDLIASKQGSCECVCDACVHCVHCSEWPSGSPERRFDLDVVCVRLALDDDRVVAVRDAAAPEPGAIRLTPRATSLLADPSITARLASRLRKYSLRGYREVLVPLQTTVFDSDFAPETGPTDARGIQQLRDALRGSLFVRTVR